MELALLLFQNACKWTRFICLNGLRPKLWLLRPKEGLLPNQTERSTSPRQFDLGIDVWFTANNFLFYFALFTLIIGNDVLVEHYFSVRCTFRAQFWFEISIVGKWCTEGIVWQREGNQWSQAGGFGLKESIERRKWSVCTTFQWSSEGVESFFYAAVRLEGLCNIAICIFLPVLLIHFF